MGDAQVQLLGLGLAVEAQQAVDDPIEASFLAQEAGFGFGAELLLRDLGHPGRPEKLVIKRAFAQAALADQFPKRFR